jgi:hypothetical protein
MKRAFIFSTVCCLLLLGVSCNNSEGELSFHSEWLIGKWQVIEYGVTEEEIKPVDPDDYWFFYASYVYEFRTDGIYRRTNGEEVLERDYFTKGNLLFRYYPSLISKEEIEKNFPDGMAYDEFIFYDRNTLKTVPRGLVTSDMSPKAFVYKRVE